MTIYVVTEGDEYHVYAYLGAYLTKERAEEVAAELRKDSPFVFDVVPVEVKE